MLKDHAVAGHQCRRGGAEDLPDEDAAKVAAGGNGFVTTNIPGYSTDFNGLELGLVNYGKFDRGGGETKGWGLDIPLILGFPIGANSSNVAW